MPVYTDDWIKVASEKEFGILFEKSKKSKSVMRYKRKTNQNRKNYGVYFHAERKGMCTGKKKCEK